MDMEYWWNETDRQIPKYLMKNLSHYHLIHQKLFLLTNVSSLSMWLTQPPIQWAPRCFLGKQNEQGCIADHYPPSGAEVKSEWSYTFTPPHAFMACTRATALALQTV
jgi:hypothetical protein